MRYLLDADVLIRAKNLHYGFDFCPAFWEWIVRENTTKKVFSIEKVGYEIMAGNDDLSEWAKKIKNNFFLKPTDKLLPALQDVSTWVFDCKKYETSAINTFKQIADYYFVAHAYMDSFSVVTHETAGSIRKIKIPDVCNGMGIECVTPFQMLRMEKARFVL